jgi:hypothetical protein
MLLLCLYIFGLEHIREARKRTDGLTDSSVLALKNSNLTHKTLTQ